MLELRPLRVGELYLSLWKTIPKVLGELHALFRRQVAEVEHRESHGQNRRGSPLQGKPPDSELDCFAQDVRLLLWREAVHGQGSPEAR